MKIGLFILLSITLFNAFHVLHAQQSSQAVPLCLVQDHPERFLNSTVQVEGLVFAGVEYPRITSEKCSLRFAFGDDYQTFGKRFSMRFDEQWTLLKKLLSKTECASNVRVAKARIRGTVIRIPATGTIPENEMPFELVIQSVSEVVHVPTNCTPPKIGTVDTILHESGHVDPPKQQ